MRSYLSKHTHLWERLAYTRIGYFCGDESLTDEIMDYLGAILFEAPLPADALEQMVSMRQRLEDSVKGTDHVKRGHGGYVDIEFIAQFGLLGGLKPRKDETQEEPRHAMDGLSPKALELVPALLKDLRRDQTAYSTRPFALPTAEAVQRLADQGIICAAAAADFLVGLALLRWIESRMRLYAGKAVSSLPTDEVERQAFARCAGYITHKNMDSDLYLVRERCRHWFMHYAQE
jgi:glutamine synthetase adenylyltransferase